MRVRFPDLRDRPGDPPVDRARPVLTVAHRGASRHAPENTLAAVRAGLASGADLIEVDVQRTGDGALVLMHDTTLTRTTDARRRLPRRTTRVSDLTLDELRTLDAGGWFSPDHAGEPVPTLDEVLTLLEGSGAGLLLELKRPELHPGIVAELASALDAHGRRASTPVPVTVQSFDVPAMKELKTRLPAVPVGLLGRPPAAHLAALATWADQVNPPYPAADPGYVRTVRAHGMSCFVWTVDRTPALRRALRLGVDGIITNRPDRLTALSTSASWRTPDLAGRIP